MDRLTVGQRHHAEDARGVFAGARHFTPEADAAIRLLLAPERIGDDLGTPSQIDVGALRAYLLFEVSGRLYATALPPSYSAVFIGCFNHNAAGQGRDHRRGGERRKPGELPQERRWYPWATPTRLRAS